MNLNQFSYSVPLHCQMNVLQNIYHVTFSLFSKECIVYISKKSRISFFTFTSLMKSYIPSRLNRENEKLATGL